MIPSLKRRKVFLKQAGNPADVKITVAKDVKAQIEFNPAWVTEYRQIGYENRQLRAEDF
ncbi:YfbK domain-containing protein [Escherichia coli]